jgi:hypothetical protein
MHSQGRFKAIEVHATAWGLHRLGEGAKSLVVFQIPVVFIHILCYIYLHCQTQEGIRVRRAPQFIFLVVQKCVKPAPCWAMEI